MINASLTPSRFPQALNPMPAEFSKKIIRNSAIVSAIGPGEGSARAAGAVSPNSQQPWI
jgi:hypothetical protein